MIGVDPLSTDMEKVLMPKCILLVEDYEPIRTAIIRLLTTEGYAVIEAESVEVAEQRLSDCEADVALLDVRLPGRTGDEFGADLKQRCGEQTKIVFLTAEAYPARLREYVPDAVILPKSHAHQILDVLRSFEAVDENTGGR